MTSKARPLFDLQDGISGVLPSSLSLRLRPPALLRSFLPRSFLPLSYHRGLPPSSLPPSLSATSAASRRPPAPVLLRANRLFAMDRLGALGVARYLSVVKSPELLIIPSNKLEL